jgi:N-acetyl-anhydromuramyl-L-alanine amidase AmpD
MTHFCVGKDGIVYQFFPLKNWAFHLGVRELPKGSLDKVSIGIEIVNVGPLVLRGDELNWWPRDYNATYCNVEDADQYYPHEIWRGFTYSATYTRAQYDSVGKLVAWLCASEGINPSIWDVDAAYKLDGLPDFSGVFTHVNCRKDKTDLSKAFNWDFFNTLMTTAYAEYKENFASYDDPLI